MTRRLWIGLLLLFDFLPLWSLMCCLSEKPMANYSSEVFAFFYNAVGVPVAAGVLYPLFGLLLSPQSRLRR
jgi:hypothetical protein